jgi:hypothetical protein
MVSPCEEHSHLPHAMPGHRPSGRDRGISRRPSSSSAAGLPYSPIQSRGGSATRERASRPGAGPSALHERRHHHHRPGAAGTRRPAAPRQQRAGPGCDSICSGESGRGCDTRFTAGDDQGGGASRHAVVVGHARHRIRAGQLGNRRRLSQPPFAPRRDG